MRGQARTDFAVGWSLRVNVVLSMSHPSLDGSYSFSPASWSSSLKQTHRGREREREVKREVERERERSRERREVEREVERETHTQTQAQRQASTHTHAHARTRRINEDRRAHKRAKPDVHTCTHTSVQSP